MKNPISTLKSLIQVLNDGHEGFKKASEDVKDTELKTLFSRFSLQRKKFAGELETELRTLGEQDPQNTGTTYAGAAHRVWFDLKAAVVGNDTHAVLAEAERGEDVAVQAYKDAIADENLTAPLRAIITRQGAEVKSTHDEVKALRDAAVAR